MANSVFDRIFEAIRGKEYPTLKDQVFCSIGLEGGDGVGKNEAALSLIKALQRAKTIEYEGQIYNMDEVAIMFTNFPMYYTPFGYLVREMNRGGFDDFAKYKKERGEELGMFEEIRVRTAMYSLDRTFNWLLMEKMSPQTKKKIIHISDRTPFSNLITLVATLQKYGQLELLPEVIDLATDADAGFKEALNWKLVTLFKSEEELGKFADGRKALDLLETEAVQRPVDAAYRAMSRIESFGGRVVETQVNGKFREAEDITKDVLSSCGIRIVSNRLSKKLPKGIRAFLPIRQGKYVNSSIDIANHPLEEPFILNPTAVYYFCFRNVISPVASDEFLKNMEEYSMLWELATFADRDKVQNLMGGVPRKEALDRIETTWADYFSAMLSVVNVSESMMFGVNPQIIASVKRLAFDYTNGLLREFITFLETKLEVERKTYFKGASKLFDTMLNI